MILPLLRKPSPADTQPTWNCRPYFNLPAQSSHLKSKILQLSLGRLPFKGFCYFDQDHWSWRNHHSLFQTNLNTTSEKKIVRASHRSLMENDSLKQTAHCLQDALKRKPESEAEELSLAEKIHWLVSFVAWSRTLSFCDVTKGAPVLKTRGLKVQTSVRDSSAFIHLV